VLLEDLFSLAEQNTLIVPNHNDVGVSHKDNAKYVLSGDQSSCRYDKQFEGIEHQSEDVGSLEGGEVREVGVHCLII